MKKTLFYSGAFALCATTILAQPVAFAGNGTQGYSGDGGLATNAQLNYISAFCGDASGNIFISDFGNADIRKVDASGIITTFAGNQIHTFAGDGGLAAVASISVHATPYGNNYNFDIAKDAAGNLYMNEMSNYRIRKVSTTGIITTIAGTGTSGNTGNGGLATSANINSAHMTCDATGNIYFTDETNNVIRKINTSGIITTIAGTGTVGYSGDGGLATSANINLPRSIVVTATGIIYFSDYNNSRIRKIDASGIISTYGGIGSLGYSGDGGLATLAKISPVTLALNPSSELVFVSMSNENALGDFNGRVNIRKINGAGVVSTVRDSSYYYQGGQYVGNMRSVFIDASNNMYYSPDFNVCVGFCDPSKVYKLSLNPQVATGIESLQSNNNLIKNYPNPSNGKFVVETALLEDASIEIFDITGKLVHNQTIVSNKTDVNINLNSGTYNLVLKANGTSINKNVVIAK